MSAGLSLMQCLAEHQHDRARYYDCVRRIGGSDGIGWDESLHAWIVTSYEACWDLLRNDALSRKRGVAPDIGATDLAACATRIMHAQLMFSDTRQGMQRRRYWSRVLSEALGSEPARAIENVAAGTMARAPLDDTFDVYVEVLQPYASRVTCACLGISDEERGDLYPLIWRYVRFLDGRVWSEAELEAAMYAIVALYDRLAARYPDDATVEGYPRHAWVADLILCICAGHESGAYLLATVFAEADQPRHTESATAPWAKVVTEALRFDSPVQMVGRSAVGPVAVGGQHIRAGDKVYLHLAAANRDPGVFDAAQEFRPGRTGPPPLSFGLGEGQCLGRSVAMRAAQAFLKLLSDREEWLVVDNSVPDHGLAGRGLRSLPGRRHKLGPGPSASTTNGAVAA